MASTPWTIRKTKRKQPATEPVTRKRVRMSDDVGRKPSSSSDLRNQQTLTQIQWVNSPHTSFEYDADLQEIGFEPTTEDTGSRSRKRRARQRDSTLTQMDWLGSANAQREELIDDLTTLPKPDGEDKENFIPQVDGAYGSPRKIRKQKPICTPKKMFELLQKAEEVGSREPKDHGLRKNDTPANPQKDTPRRRSTRIASKAHTKPEFECEPGHRDEPSAPNSNKHAKPNYQNESASEPIRSIETTESQRMPRNIVQPHTPRRRKEVPSSQTPETLVKVRSRVPRNRNVSPSKPQGRTPLRDKSTNIQSGSYSQGLKASKAMLGYVSKSPKRSKICVLKVPSKELLRRSGRKEDTERDIFSLPATSSSGQGDHMLATSRPTEGRRQDLLRKDESIEIPPTSEPRASSESEMPSSPPVIETQGSLPELSDLIPARTLVSTPIAKCGHEDRHTHTFARDSVLVHDFGRKSQNNSAAVDREGATTMTEKVADEDEMLLDNDMHVLEPAGEMNSEKPSNTSENESDLGSPVRNDTQFNVNLLQRTSSPTSATDVTKQSKSQRSVSVSGSPTPKRIRRTPSKDVREEAGLDTETPIPTPRLVQNRGTPTEATLVHDDDVPISDAALPSSDGYETVSTVPLNDVPQLPPSSPPMLPPARPMTQRSIHPASMPRPSQVSTQAPTQNDFPSSAPAATQGHTEVERILIKDSSSVPPRLSQIPSNIGKSQSQGQNLRFIGNSDDEIDDLDLDPASSTLRHRHSARKHHDLLRKETGSSLKSIHLPLPKSSEQQIKTTLDRSSSPPLEPLMPPPRPRNARQGNGSLANHETALESDLTSSPLSSPNPSPLKKKYDPIPGFDNDTQSNFTQDGHITAAYIHREREAGRLPDWFTPLPHQIPNFTGRAKDKRKTNRERS